MHTENVSCGSMHLGMYGVLADAPPRLTEHSAGVLPELPERHTGVALRLHPGHGSQYVVHVPREPLEENARPLVEGDDEPCLRDHLRSRLGLGEVGGCLGGGSRASGAVGCFVARRECSNGWGSVLKIGSK